MYLAGQFQAFVAPMICLVNLSPSRILYLDFFLKYKGADAPPPAHRTSMKLIQGTSGGLTA
jgi:hypothetical protein